MLLKVRNYRRVERADIDVSKIALVCGLNGAGKTSIVEAAQAVLLRLPLVHKGALVKTAKERLVKTGADDGRAQISAGEGNFAAVMWPACQDSMKGNAPIASPVAAGTISLVDGKPDARATLLRSYIKADPSMDDIKAALTDAGFSEKNIEQTIAALEKNGWDSCHAIAAESSTKMKGQWEGLTGERWGTEKAATWVPDGWNPEWAEITKDAAVMDEVDAASAVERAVSNGAVSAHELEKLREIVATGAFAEVNDKRLALDTVKMEQEQARTQLGLLPPDQDTKTIECPCCNKLLVYEQAWSDKPAVLKPFTGEVVSDQLLKDRRMARASLEGTIARLGNDIRAAENALANAEKIRDAAAAASVRLEELESEGGANDALTAAREALEAVKKRRAMIDRFHDARALHARWTKNAALIEILGPGGLRKKALTKALADFNGLLTSACHDAKWGIVWVDESLSVLMDKTPYEDLSESMQMRVRVTLQIVMAKIDHSSMVVIDRVDMLDFKGKSGLFTMLGKAQIPALLAMTANKPEPPAVPPLKKAKIGVAYWMNDGVAEEIPS